LEVFIVVQNLVVIDAVVLIIEKFEYVVYLAWKRRFRPSNRICWIWPRKLGEVL